MKKHELLVPVGDMECLKQAIANGADAVYGGCQNFGARKFAKNFTNEEIVEAIRLCHLYDVKFYATMNTLVKDSEVPYFLGQIEFLYKQGVDAVIMQDFGMISYVLQHYPNLEVHASTQCNNSSYDIVKLFYDMGVKRVVFSRELSLEEIENITVPIEKEVFIHGALCISYSGCCLMSSMIGGRSGNRGECAGSCRLPYQLFYDEQKLIDTSYLLSTKELNTSYHIKELLNSDIYSFKIEGRMKSPEYVGFITRMYRHLIDSNGDINGLDLENEKLKTIFNREFTSGHLFHCSVEELMNTVSPNHIGLPIGKVIEVNAQKIRIQLNKDLHQGDGIRFLESGKGFIVNYLYDDNGMLVSSVTRGNVCSIDNKVGLEKAENVSKTLDFLLMQDMKILPSRSIPITFLAKARIGQPFIVEVSDGIRKVQVSGSIVQESITSPVSDIRIRTQLEKLGGTPFVSKATVIEKDSNVFIPLREINELRRSLIQQLLALRVMPRYQPIISNVTFSKLSLHCDNDKTALVYNEEQMEVCLKLGFHRIYTPNLSLFKQNQIHDNVYYSLPRTLLQIEGELRSRNLVREICNFSNYDGLIGDYTLNVYNIYTAYYLYQLGLSKLTLSVELSSLDIIDFINRFEQAFGCKPNVEVISYGLVEDMVIKGNILNLKENVYHYSLRDLRGRKFPVYYKDNRTILLNYVSFNLSEFLSLKDAVSLRYQFFMETKDEIINIVKNNQ